MYKRRIQRSPAPCSRDTCTFGDLQSRHTFPCVCKLAILLVLATLIFLVLTGAMSCDKAVTGTTLHKLQYSKSELIQLRKESVQVSSEVHLNVCNLGIQRRRGRRAGRKIRRRIQVVNQSHEFSKRFANSSLRSSTLQVINTHGNGQRGFLPSILLVNARSLSNKFDDFEPTISTQHKSIHVIAVTETWFTADKPASCYNLPNFHLFHRDRIAQRGGGVALYIRDDINSRVVFEEQVPAHLEIVWV